MKHQWNNKVFHFCCEKRDLLCNYSNGDHFTSEDIMFSRKSSPGISLVCIYFINMHRLLSVIVALRVYFSKAKMHTDESILSTRP